MENLKKGKMVAVRITDDLYEELMACGGITSDHIRQALVDYVNQRKETIEFLMQGIKKGAN